MSSPANEEIRNRFLKERAESEREYIRESIRDFESRPIKHLMRDSAEYWAILSNPHYLNVYKYAHYIAPLAEVDEIGCDPEFRYLLEETHD